MFLPTDGIVPGPTFMMERGVNSLVRFINNAEKENSVHLHGSYSVSIILQRCCKG